MFGKPDSSSGGAVIYDYVSNNSLSYHRYYQYPSKLTEVTVTDQERIPDFAFSSMGRNSDGLTTVTLPEKTTAIGMYAFYNCSRLVQTNVPGSVSRIGEKAYYGCSSLNVVTYPSLVLREFMLADGAIAQGNEPLLNVTWSYSIEEEFRCPAFLTEIEAEAFSGISAVQILLPAEVVSIGAEAFGNCASLQYLFIPGMTTELAEGVLAGSSQAAVVCCEGSAAHQWCLDNNVRAIVKR